MSVLFQYTECVPYVIVVWNVSIHDLLPIHTTIFDVCVKSETGFDHCKYLSYLQQLSYFSHGSWIQSCRVSQSKPRQAPSGLNVVELSVSVSDAMVKTFVGTSLKHQWIITDKSDFLGHIGLWCTTSTSHSFPSLHNYRLLTLIHRVAGTYMNHILYRVIWKFYHRSTLLITQWYSLI